MSDPEGRPSLGDYVEGRKQRLFHVGRLDADTEGLILLTNDGELGAPADASLARGPKTYLADIPAPVPRDLGRRLREGIELDDGPARVDASGWSPGRRPGPGRDHVLHEGRNHIVRRMLAAVDHPVDRLVRTTIGPVRLGDLRPGKVRPLNRAEVGELYNAVGL